MSLKNALTIVLVLALTILVVVLILCRPMGAENYADGDFAFDDVTLVRCSAGIYDPEGEAPEELVFTDEARELGELVDIVEDKGFGRTPAAMFTSPEPEPQAGDMIWTVTYLCGGNGSSVTLDYRGGQLRILGGGETVTVTTQYRGSWVRSVYDLIAPLYPDPEAEEQQ